MMNSNQQHKSSLENPDTDKEDWAPLYVRIRTLAMRRSAAMIGEGDEDIEEFDRGARALRTLMSAAEVARRMKALDAKEDALNDGKERPPIISDAQIRDVYNTITQTVERIARDDKQDASDQGDALAVSPDHCGETMEDKCP